MNDDLLPLYPQTHGNHVQKFELTTEVPPSAPAPITTAPVMEKPVLPLLLGPENAVTTCPHCQCAVRTTIKHVATSRTHMLAIMCTFICCCCCLPYCMNSARNTNHYCPNCFKYLGAYEK